ncbi:MAG: ABC transporter ATP-binding protein [Pseudomonadota bacterium]|nr:ABC transporter ATP-binding protein [Pseudomonadota bacterium]
MTPTPFDQPSRAEQYRSARKLDLDVLARIVRIALHYPVRVSIAVSATLLSSVFQLFIPRYVGKAVDHAQGLLDQSSATQGDIETALLIAGMMIIGLSILRGSFAVIQNYFGESVDHCLAAELRNRFYHRVQQLDLSFHDHAHTGDLITRGMLDLEGIRYFPSTGLVRTLMLLVLVIGGAVILLSTNFVLGLVALSFVPVIAVSSAVARLKLRYLWLKQQERLTRLTNFMEENLTGIRIVRAFYARDHEISRFQIRSAGVLEIAYKRLMARVKSTTFMGLVFYIAMTGVLWVGGNMVLTGQITVGRLTEFLAFMMILQMPVRQIGMTVNSFARASTCGTRLFAVLDEPSLVDANADRPDLKVTQGIVRFENVDFQYPLSRSSHNTISDISFEIGSGQTLGIVGPPGSGKSTIARLIPRFYEPTAGRILIDGQDISRVSLTSLREAIGGVQQDPFLFTAAVDHNVAYADPLASTDQIVQASTDAQIHSFIKELPQNYQTLVGEDGVSLSGGQKQRISIARGTLTDAPIFIFDDATAAIDAGTEQHIRHALNEQVGTHTTIIISHRLVSLMHADEILFLDEGRIVEHGTHEQLLALKGRYFALHSLQLRDENQSSSFSEHRQPA